MSTRFVPVKPETGWNPRHPLLSLRKAGRNLLFPFGEVEFSRKLFSFKILRQPYLVCNAPEHVREAFATSHENLDRKSPPHRKVLEAIVGDGLFVSDGQLWDERRDACSPALRPTLLPSFFPRMVETALEVRRHWEALPPTMEIDVLREMAVMTARIIGRTVFGDEVPEEEALQVVHGFSNYQAASNPLRLGDCTGVPALNLLENPFKRRAAKRSAVRVHEVVDGIIARHHARGSASPNTLLAFLLEPSERSGRCPMADDAARNESIVMFMAGHETTANLLTWCWYLLDGCQDSRRALHEELDTVLDGRAPTFEDLPRLVFTRAVVEETLRLYPPIPILSRQARQAGTVGGQAYERGTIILVVPWLLHRHRRFWREPDTFKPERFLPDEPRPDRYLYLPFSVGPRVCLGARFGLTEAVTCLAILAQRFSPRLAAGHRVDVNCRMTLRPDGGLPMSLTRRGRFES